MSRPLSIAENADAAVAIDGLDKRFLKGRGVVHALSNIDLAVPEGSFVTLFGPSGCGKSTLLRIVAGLEEHDSGAVSLFGESPREASERKNIGWIPQAPALLPWLSIRRNALLSDAVNTAADRHGRSSRHPLDVDAILAELGLAEFADALPAQLSGGMRQRAAIARGFVQGSPLLLMDEPFSALDELTRENARQQLLAMWDHYRKTVMFVTHSAFEAVALSDYVVVMTPRPGRIADVIEIDLPRPRGPQLEDTPEFTHLVQRVKHALRDGWKDES